MVIVETGNKAFGKKVKQNHEQHKRMKLALASRG